MDNESINKALFQSITEARESAGISLNALSGKSGIPYATLHRKLNQRAGSLTISDFHAIAKALDVPAGSLFPEVEA